MQYQQPKATTSIYNVFQDQKLDIHKFNGKEHITNFQ